MRKFRNAALAGATAMALTFSGTSVAMAQDTQTQQAADQAAAAQPATDNTGDKAPASEKSSANAKGTDIFGSQRVWKDVPSEWKALYAGTWILGIVAVLALVAAPIDNFIKYGPFAK